MGAIDQKGQYYMFLCQPLVEHQIQHFQIQKEKHLFSIGELAMDHWPWMPELRGIFLSLTYEEIFKNGINIIQRSLKDM